MNDENEIYGKGPFVIDENGNPTDIGLHSLEDDVDTLEYERLEVISTAIDRELVKRTGMNESNGYKFKKNYENLLIK